jgi:hypothetical protein
VTARDLFAHIVPTPGNFRDPKAVLLKNVLESTENLDVGHASIAPENLRFQVVRPAPMQGSGKGLARAL